MKDCKWNLYIINVVIHVQNIPFEIDEAKGVECFFIDFAVA